MDRNIEAVAACGASIEDLPVEIVERKGIGHPDSLCDGIAERISIDYTRWCEENIGRRLHHNFDKVQIVAGEADLAFGRGEMTRNILVQIAGRALAHVGDRRIPVAKIAETSAREYLRGTLRNLDPDRHVDIDARPGEGDPALIHTVGEVVKANDTSFGCGHWPLSALERVVLETCEHVNRVLIDSFPIGEDVKVMGLRREGRILLTCAIPFLVLEVHSREQYYDLKEKIRGPVTDFARSVDGRVADVVVNHVDDGDDVHRLLTGTSAERGDDGAVGRGNRVNGLITPFRSVSLEAACGKNPMSHVGKIYNVLASQAARRIVEEVEEVTEAVVHVLSQIGEPIDRPLVASATVLAGTGTVSGGVRDAVRAVLDRELDAVHGITDQILEGKDPLF